MLREQLANAEGDLKEATARLQTRAVLGKEIPTDCVYRCSTFVVRCRRLPQKQLDKIQNSKLKIQNSKNAATARPHTRVVLGTYLVLDAGTLFCLRKHGFQDSLYAPGLCCASIWPTRRTT